MGILRYVVSVRSSGIRSGGGNVVTTNRKFEMPPGAKAVDLSAEPPGPPPDASKPYVYLAPKLGWMLVVTDDPEDRTSLCEG